MSSRLPNAEDHSCQDHNHLNKEVFYKIHKQTTIFKWAYSQRKTANNLTTYDCQIY